MIAAPVCLTAKSQYKRVVVGVYRAAATAATAQNGGLAFVPIRIVTFCTCAFITNWGINESERVGGGGGGKGATGRTTFIAVITAAFFFRRIIGTLFYDAQGN